MARVALKRPPVTTPAEIGPFFSSGSYLLDKINGGGWAHGRMINIVGDSSVGKTVLAVEACANFAALHGAENIRFNETEAALMRDFAYRVGMPRGASFVGDDPKTGKPTHGSVTIEEFAEDYHAFVTKPKSGPSLYILDSCDACPAESELKKDYGDTGYNMDKQKVLHSVLRQTVRIAEECLCTLIIVSQMKDKIGVLFGETKTRSGGKALDYFASQIVWLSELARIREDLAGVRRVTGINVRALNRKNKMGLARREVDFVMSYNYGIDDEQSMINWLRTVKLGSVKLEIGVDEMARDMRTARKERDRDLLSAVNQALRVAVGLRWAEIEAAGEPEMTKYG